MKFEIITRCKNISGETYKYNVIIVEQGRVVEIPKETLRNLSADVVNADWIESIQDFRAHKGIKIETITDKIGLNSKPVLNNKEELPKMRNDNAIGIKYINVCKKIRTFALQNRIQVEKTKHIANEGRNTELFEICKGNCEKSRKDHIEDILLDISLNKALSLVVHIICTIAMILGVILLYSALMLISMAVEIHYVYSLIASMKIIVYLTVGSVLAVSSLYCMTKLN